MITIDGSDIEQIRPMVGLDDYHEKLRLDSSSSSTLTEIHQIQADDVTDGIVPAVEIGDYDDLFTQEVFDPFEPEAISDSDDETNDDDSEELDSWDDAINSAKDLDDGPHHPMDLGTVPLRLSGKHALLFSDGEWEVVKILRLKDNTPHVYIYQDQSSDCYEYDFPLAAYGRENSSDERWVLLKRV